jgi:hypothetical protein
MIGTDYTIGKQILNKMKTTMSKRQLANLMFVQGADDEREYELILTAQAYYACRDSITIGGKPLDADMIGDEKVFEAKMLLLGNHNEVRKAYMAGDYDKCDELGNEFFAEFPMEESKLRVERFVDENIDEWEKKGLVGRKSWKKEQEKNRKRNRRKINRKVKR